VTEKQLLSQFGIDLCGKLCRVGGLLEQHLDLWTSEPFNQQTMHAKLCETFPQHFRDQSQEMLDCLGKLTEVMQKLSEFVEKSAAIQDKLLRNLSSARSTTAHASALVAGHSSMVAQPRTSVKNGPRHSGGQKRSAAADLQPTKKKKKKKNNNSSAAATPVAAGCAASSSTTHSHSEKDSSSDDDKSQTSSKSSSAAPSSKPTSSESKFEY
jgi:hypothetical protein